MNVSRSTGIRNVCYVS